MGEGARLVCRIPQQQFDQPGLEAQPRTSGRLLDRLAKRTRRHRAHDLDLIGHERREVRVRGARIQEVRADDDHDGPGLGRLGDRRRGVVDVGLTGVEDLLELIDHDDIGAASTADGVAHAHSQVAPRDQEGDPVAAPSQRRDDPRAHERRLAAARGSRHREGSRARETSERRADLGGATEEVVLVVDAERREPAVRARVARSRRHRSGGERRVVPEDGDLDRPQLITRLGAELGVEPLLGRTDRRQGVRLPSAAIQRGREQGPAAFAQRRIADESLRVADGCGVLPEPEPGLQPHLLEAHPHLSEPLGLDDGRGPVGQVGVRRAAPQHERPVGGIDRACGVAVREVVPGG
nr:hypothetical protein [Agromyces marinus]